MCSVSVLRQLVSILPDIVLYLMWHHPRGMSRYGDSLQVGPVVPQLAWHLRILLNEITFLWLPLTRALVTHYCSGHTRTTVDYIIVNHCASYLMITSEVLNDHPLDTSDHLAVCAVMEVNPIQTWKDITE